MKFEHDVKSWLEGYQLPSSCSAFSRGFTVNWFRWHFLDERPGHFFASHHVTQKRLTEAKYRDLETRQGNGKGEMEKEIKGGTVDSIKSIPNKNVTSTRNCSWLRDIWYTSLWFSVIVPHLQSTFCLLLFIWHVFLVSVRTCRLLHRVFTGL